MFLRARGNSSYTKRFASLEDAKSLYGLSLSDTLAELVINRPKPGRPINTSPQALSAVDSLLKLACCLEDHDLEELTNKLFHQLTLTHNLTSKSNPLNFYSLFIKAMELLKRNNNNSLLHKFALELCQTKPGTDEPVFQKDKMLFDLNEHQIEFFSCALIRQVNIIIIQYNTVLVI